MIFESTVSKIEELDQLILQIATNVLVYYPLLITEVEVYFAQTRTNENICAESYIQSEQFL